MAASMTATSHTMTSSYDEMTDEQMQQLLAAAAARIRAESQKEVQILQEKSPRYTFPKLSTGELPKPYVSTSGEVAVVNNSEIPSSKRDKKEVGLRKVDDPVALKKAALEKKKATAGSDWYDLPKTELTPELKRDLQLLKMRNVLDPHRHYKKDGGKMQAPAYSQVGTIIQGPTEFFSGRIENKQRKKTFVEEVLAGEQETGRFKKKYGDLQSKKTSGKKAFYKALQEKRKGGISKR